MAAEAGTTDIGPAAAPAGLRLVSTPEGIPVSLRLADRGERAAALLIDLLIMGAAIAGLFLAVGLMLAELLPGWSEDGTGWVVGSAFFAWFLIRSFYFVFFELRWQGATPGKKALGIRVVDRYGGRLRSDAIFARNLMREVELYLPINLLLAMALPQWRSPVETWELLLTAVWIGVFLSMPFFNKDRMRAGDIVGGTWVIRQPKAELLTDIAERSAAREGIARAVRPDFAFTAEQLAVYGIYELQTLETVLRQDGPQADATRAEVALRIQRKIGWTGAAPDPRRFLEAFYAAQRSRLETQMLFGKRRRDKDDQS